MSQIRFEHTARAVEPLVVTRTFVSPVLQTLPSTAASLGVVLSIKAPMSKSKLVYLNGLIAAGEIKEIIDLLNIEIHRLIEDCLDFFVSRPSMSKSPEFEVPPIGSFLLPNGGVRRW